MSTLLQPDPVVDATQRALRDPLELEISGMKQR